MLTERRKQAHLQHLDRITAHAYHYYHAPPHPNEIASAQAALKRGIDEDWQASVQRISRGPRVLLQPRRANIARRRRTGC